MGSVWLFVKGYSFILVLWEVCVVVCERVFIHSVRGMLFCLCGFFGICLLMLFFSYCCSAGILCQFFSHFFVPHCSSDVYLFYPSSYSYFAPVLLCFMLEGYLEACAAVLHSLICRHSGLLLALTMICA